MLFYQDVDGIDWQYVLVLQGVFEVLVGVVFFGQVCGGLDGVVVYCFYGLIGESYCFLGCVVEVLFIECVLEVYDVQVYGLVFYVGVFCLGYVVVVDVDNVIEYVYGGFYGVCQFVVVESVVDDVLGEVY